MKDEDFTITKVETVVTTQTWVVFHKPTGLRISLDSESKANEWIDTAIEYWIESTLKKSYVPKAEDL